MSRAPLNISLESFVARKPTEWDIEASIKAFLHPPPTTIDEAMASPHPVTDVICSFTSEDSEKLAQLTTRLTALDSTMRVGLLELLKEHRKSFSLTRG